MLTILYLTNLIKITYCGFIFVSYIALNHNVFVLCIELVELQQEKPLLEKATGCDESTPPPIVVVPPSHGMPFKSNLAYKHDLKQCTMNHDVE